MRADAPRAPARYGHSTGSTRIRGLRAQLGGSAEFTPIDGTDSIMGICCSPGDGTLIGGLVSFDGDWLVEAGRQAP